MEEQFDNLETLDSLNRRFATNAFARQPIGVEINFEELAGRLRKGEPERALLQPLQA